jgi:2'-5' RNA ligase
MTSRREFNAFFCLRIPPGVVEALIALQDTCRDRLDPQHPEDLHITLGFLRGADERRLAEARALVEDGSWPAPVIRLTGVLRHGSWTLQKDPGYRYDEQVARKGEQIRLGVEHTPELARIQQEITGGLDIPEDGFWPHVTLGLVRDDLPAAEFERLGIPAVTGTAPGVDVRREVSPTEFTTVLRKELALC